MEQLEVRKIPGIGRMTELILNNLGIKTCWDLEQKKMEIYIAFSQNTALFLIRSCLGIARCYHASNDEDSI